jgi:hypothetical protein
MLLKILPLALYTSRLSVQAAKQIMPILRILRYNGSLVTLTVVSLTTGKFKPHRFSISGFALSYSANVFIAIILYDFCLLSAQFCYIILYRRKAESCVQVADRRHLGIFPVVLSNLSYRRCNFKR